MLETATDLKQLVAYILKTAKTKGASQAEASASIGEGLSVNVRCNEVDTVEFNRDKGIGITVYYGQQKGSASTADTRKEAIDHAITAACDIAQSIPEDSFAGLADPSRLAKDYPQLDLEHPWLLDAPEAIELAKQCEQIGLQQDKRLTNSEGCAINSHHGHVAYGNSQGFLGQFSGTRHSVSCVLVATDKNDMQRDYYYSSARDPQMLESLDTIAKKAAERALSRLHAKRLKTQQAPVIFHPDLARGLLGHFISAISGGSLYRKASFLLDSLGKPIFGKHISIEEQPHIPKALGSAPFDDEGVANQQHAIVKDGVLESYVLSSYSARKLGMKTTGNAGGVRNLVINHSDNDLSGLLKQMGTGLLVTELLGHGINMVTGDYSRGAAGFWVENGEIQYPVSEITIAGNLRDMFKQIVAVGNDVDRRGNVHTGSILIEQMTIAGE